MPMPSSSVFTSTRFSGGMSLKQLGAGCALAVALFPSADAAELRGTIRGFGMRRATDAVVYINAIRGRAFSVPRDPALMETKDLMFAPTVLPVLVGTTVEFANRDEMGHNVFSSRLANSTVVPT